MACRCFHKRVLIEAFLIADIVPQQVAVSTLLEKYRQQHPELVHVQPQPQVHQQTNGTKSLKAPGAADVSYSVSTLQPPFACPCKTISGSSTHKGQCHILQEVLA